MKLGLPESLASICNLCSSTDKNTKSNQKYFTSKESIHAVLDLIFSRKRVQVFYKPTLDKRHYRGFDQNFDHCNALKKKENKNHDCCNYISKPPLKING